MFWLLALYGFGLRSAGYAAICRFSDARDDYYPSKNVKLCGTEARNVLSIFGLLSEILDVILSVYCLPEFYILRKALVDGITVARYNERSKPRYYAIFILIGLSIYTVTVCGKYGFGAAFDTSLQLISELLMKDSQKVNFR